MIPIKVCIIIECSGKTVILDAGVGICIQFDSIQVHYISALDYAEQDKRTEDVLDVAIRLRYQDTNVRFQNVVTLR